MQLSRALLLLALALAPIAFLSTIWLYLYPLLHGCTFPVPPTGGGAPFRLLALGDPQLEGDSSLPDPNAPIFPSLRYVAQDLTYAPTLGQRVDIIRNAATGVVGDARRWLEGKRKAVDLWGNDWYLAHIVRQTWWWTRPSHVAVLGDLLGSQWITDGEFEKRAGRYWRRVMRGLEEVPGRVYGVEEQEDGGAEKVVDVDGQVEEQKGEGEKEGGELLRAIEEEAREDAGQEEERSEDAEQEQEQEQKKEHNAEHQEEEEKHKPLRKPSWGGTTEVLGADRAWAKRVINIAGNHDVGYAGDLDVSRIARFEKAFGSVNWDIWFTLPPDNTTLSIDPPPALRIVVLNSMNIDAPAWNHELQTETYDFMNHIITNSRDVSDKTHATILLTHIPLEKKHGVCVDSPLFNYFDDGQGLREQNMLSEHSSKTILQGVFGMSDNPFAAGQGFGRRGIILNGHDHEGCDTMHFIRQQGVVEQCNIDTINPNEAYWPTPTSTSAPEPTTSIAPEAYETSPANPLNNNAKCDMPVPDDRPPPPALAPTGWLAHPFPPRPYSITHDPFTNASSCTAIASSPNIREITLRSMMGDFSGHAGFLSAWFDSAKGDRGEWVFEFHSCGVGVQHWWWGVHSLDVAVVVVGMAAGMARVWERWGKKVIKRGREGNGDVNGKIGERGWEGGSFD